VNESAYSTRNLLHFQKDSLEQMSDTVCDHQTIIRIMNTATLTTMTPQLEEL